VPCAARLATEAYEDNIGAATYAADVMEAHMLQAAELLAS